MVSSRLGHLISGDGDPLSAKGGWMDSEPVWAPADEKSPAYRDVKTVTTKNEYF
jgi:hypothetical protein